jgi:uncharacterized membrane protein YkvA (DUF1232 family)
MTWLLIVVVAVGCLVATGALLLLLARRLPAGLAKELAGFLPNCVRMARRLRSHPEVPRRARLAVAFAAVWVLSPIDLIPEFVPVIGPLDDIVVVALALRYAARQVPRRVIHDAWDGDPDVLDRLLGPPARAT